jgi:hypothetical protein
LLALFRNTSSFLPVKWSFKAKFWHKSPSSGMK